MPRRRGSRRWVSGAAAAAVVGTAVTVLASCASDPEVEPTAAVSVFGPWRDRAAEAFREAVRPFEDQTGIEVTYTGTGSFATDLVDRLEDGAPPDVAVFPQPGLMADLADRGLLVPLEQGVAAAAGASYSQPVRDAVGDAIGSLGVLYRLNLKSLVWYPPRVFDAYGYRVPSTWQELEDLTERVTADGRTPWCLGVDAFAASGWPATDWVEDVLLRHQPLGVYDDWTDGTVGFTDERVADAYRRFASLVLEPERVVGGRRAVLNTSVEDAQVPMFDDPPGCLMYRQASFQVENLDTSVQVGPDGDTDVFVLPGRDSSPPPLLVGGTFVAAATDRPETWRLMEYLADPDGSSSWVADGGFISPHAEVSTDDYGRAFDARVARLMSEAETLRFDSSDLMTPAVGTGTFFESMVSFIANNRLEEALELAQSGYGD